MFIRADRRPERLASVRAKDQGMIWRRRVGVISAIQVSVAKISLLWASERDIVSLHF
jgi:hypothetical protein